MALAFHLRRCLNAPERLSRAASGKSMEALGCELRGIFIECYGYKPAESTTPCIPVTINGPGDPDEYHQQHPDEA